MKNTLTLACFMTASTLAAQCTVTDLDFDSLSVRWADGYDDAQGNMWGAAVTADGTGDVLALRFDGSGDIVWSIRFATVNPFIKLYPTKAIATATGGMLIIGNRVMQNHENWFGLQVDANGVLEWARIYMEPISSWDGYGAMPMVALVPSGGYQITIPGGDQVHTTRLAADGTPVWHKRYTSTVGTYGYDLSDVAVGGDGSVYLLAGLNYEGVPDTISTLLIKTDADGEPLWGRHIGGHEKKLRTLLTAANGDLVLGGGGNWWYWSGGYGTPTATRLAADGSVLWSREYDHPGSIRSMIELGNGDLLMAPAFHYAYQAIDTTRTLHVAGDGTPVACYRHFEPTDYDWNAMSTWLPERTDVIAGPVGSVSVMCTLDDEDGVSRIQRIHDASGTGFACSMATDPLSSTIEAGVTSEPVSVSSSLDTVRTWTMALVGYDQIAMDLVAYLYGGIPPRPGFTHTLHGGIWNYGGNTSGPPTVTLAYDPLTTFVSADPPATTVTSTTVTWEVASGISGFDALFFNATFSVPADTALLGDQLISTLSVEQDSAEVNLNENVSTITQTIVGSYDPNDKLVFPKDVYHIENDSVLDYTIRFQNTGTFMAETVVIRDTLPLDLDVLTFRIGAASHPFTYSLTGNGILEVRFDNIDLPDSNANEPLSHGMIGFRIKPILPLALGQVITNTADIYFDFNPPILTPDATVIVTDETGIHPAVKPEKLGVFPVPVRTTLTAQLPAGFEPVSAIAIGTDGRRIPLFRPNVVEKRAEYGVQHLPPGAYVLTLVDKSGKRMSARFTKE